MCLSELAQQGGHAPLALKHQGSSGHTEDPGLPAPLPSQVKEPPSPGEAWGGGGSHPSILGWMQENFPAWEQISQEFQATHYLEELGCDIFAVSHISPE